MMAALLALWQQQSRRIDARSLRERAMLFGTLAVAMVAAADTLLIAPRMAEQKAIATQMRQQTRELDTLRLKQAQASSVAADSPQGKLLAALKDTQVQRRQVDADITAATAGGPGVARLPDVLERLLRRHDRLTLISLDTAAAPPPRDGAPVSAWQGVDLQLAGNYPELVPYLEAIETALPGVRWGALQIDGTTRPPLLKLRLFMHGDRP